MSRLTQAPRPAKPLLVLALLLAAVAALLLRPTASPAKVARSACSAPSAKGRHVRACAGRTRSGRSHGKAKGRRSGRRHPIKKSSPARRLSAGAPALAATPAVCEDGSQPHGDGDGTFSCGDDSEPVCASGVEAVPTKGAKLVCPVAAGPGVEWSEAECADGSNPASSAGGEWTCEDGSRPVCPEGTTARPAEDDSTLLCVAHGASSPPAEEDEGESEDEVSSARVATAS
jgi:hypothetical protein